MTDVDSSSGFPSETQCNFDLKFGDLEGDDDVLMSCGGDLFTSSQTAPAAVLRDFGDHTSPQDDHSHTTPDRKRKMDKEGFVTPATPDIPKSSLLYESKEVTTRSELESSADGLILGGHHHHHQQQQQEQQQLQQQQQPQPQRKKHKQRKPHHDVTDTLDMSASAQEPTTKRYECAADMFEDVAQRTKMLIIQMAQNFRESEEYESMCLANVEALLMEARDLETSLRHQKDLLQERIFMIGRRLSTDNQ